MGDELKSSRWFCKLPETWGDWRKNRVALAETLGMPIDTKCPGCGRLLRVGDEHAGRQARCPACCTIYVVPGGQTAAPSPTTPIAADGNPFGDRGEGLGSGVGMAVREWAASPARNVVPHRGGLILVLGILAWIIGCPIFGAVAWIMGSSDMREMRCGRMDPAGLGTTQAGYILGMINSILWIIGAVLVVAFLMIGLAASVAG